MNHARLPAAPERESCSSAPGSAPATARWMGRGLAGACLALAAGPLRAQEGPVVLFTADRAGELAPRAVRAGAAKQGGVTRAGTLVRAERARGDVLLLDGGNAFFAADDAPGDPSRAVRNAYDALGYQVVNVGHPDLRRGVDALRELLDGASFTPVSANIFSDGGQRLFDPYTLVEVGEWSVAIVGVTAEPPGLRYLPRLRKQFAGVTVGDPLDALAEVLPRAGAGSDRVVLLCYGDRDLVEAVHARFGDQLDAIAVGGVGLTGRLPGGSPPVAAATREGRHLARLVLGSDRAPEQLEISGDVAPDPELEASLASVLARASPELEDPLRGLAPGAPVALDARSGPSWSGAGLNLRVTSVARAAEWQGLDAPAGSEWLVFDADVENDIPSSLASRSGRSAGERLRVVQKQKLFLLHGEDARAVAAAAVPERPTDPDGLLPDDLVLSFVGDVRGGQVAFAVPTASIDGGVLQLRWYHDEVPPAVVTVRGRIEPAADLAAAANEYVELARPVVTFPDAWNGLAPPTGARWVSVALAGRSLSVGAAPAAEQEPRGPLGLGRIPGPGDGDGGARAAAEGDPELQPRPAYYLEAASHLELVVDGQWARRAEPGLGTLPPEPTFLPDRFTGGTAVFLAPRDARSLELSCAFPLLTLENGDGLKPGTVRFALEGEPAEPAPEPAAVVVEDAPLPLAVVGVERRPAVGVRSAEDGRTLVVLDCRIENRGSQEGLFAPSGRFRIPGDDSMRALGAVDRIGLPLAEPFLLPVGERRAFRILLDAPDGIGGRVRVSYAGTAVNPTFELEVPGIDGAPAPVVAEAAPDRPDPALAGAGEAEDTAAPASSSIWRDRPPGAVEPTWAAEPGELEPTAREASADGLTLSVTAASLGDTLNDHPARDGTLFLDLEVGIALAADAAPVRIERLPERLVAVLDGRVALDRGSNVRGGLPGRLVLEPGEAATGRVVFVLPREPFRSLSLNLVPPVHPGVRLPVFSGPERPDPARSLANRAFRVDLLGYGTARELDGQEAAPGATFVAVELRVQNRLSGLDPTDAGELETARDLLPWQVVRERVQLVIDGLHSVPMLPNVPSDRHLFDLVTLPSETLGGRLVFAAPDELLARARSVELLCGFDEVERPGGGILRPALLRFPLAGERPDIVPPPALHRVEDDGLEVLVTSLDDVPEGLGTVPNRTWVAAEVWLRAAQTAPEDPRADRANRGVDVDPARAFAALDAAGKPCAPHGQSFGPGSPSHGGRPFWVPPGEVRRLELAFLVSQPEADGIGLLHRGLLDARVFAFDTDAEPGQPQADPLRATSGQLVLDTTLVPKGLAGVGLEGRQVNEAIERGRAFLWSHVREKTRGDDFGVDRYNLPPFLALLHCDSHRDVPEFDRAVRDLLGRLDPTERGSYELGLLAMIVEAYEDPTFLPLLHRIVACLVEGQSDQGSWSYTPEFPARLSPTAQDEAPATAIEVEGGEPPGARDTAEPVIRTQSWLRNQGGDNSVSQFAVLGLATADRHGIAVDEETWRRSLAQSNEWHSLSTTAEHQGGWSYGAGWPYGSMTCAGLCSTAIAVRRLDPTRDPRRALRVRDGLAWLDRHWTLAENPGKKEDWRYYYLYGIERVGRILGLEFIGGHEWYPEGAKVLVNAQGADGSWVGSGSEADPRLATSFALLFLTRATESLALDGAPEETPGGPGTLYTQADVRATADRVYVILDASGSMLGDVGGRRKFDVAREAVAALASRLPEGTSFALRAYGHRKRAIEDGASEDTELLLPFAPLDIDALGATLARTRPRGKTPITLSLEEAAEDVRAARGAGDTLVFLLTDGGEDTRRDPVAAARKLAELNGVVLRIVGLDIDRSEWSTELEAVATAARGSYVQVEEAEDLVGAVVHEVAPEPPVFVLTGQASEHVAEGRFGDSLELPPGPYTLSFEYAGEPLESSFWIHPGRTTRVRFDPSAPR